MAADSQTGAAESAGGGDLRALSRVGAGPASLGAGHHKTYDYAPGAGIFA